MQTERWIYINFTILQIQGYWFIRIIKSRFTEKHFNRVFHILCLCYLWSFSHIFKVINIHIGHVIFLLFNNSILITTILDRKSTRLNSSHVSISYAVFCLKNKSLVIYI